MLDGLRREIDSIDEKIIKLINERYKHVIEIGHLKKKTSHEIYVPEREKSLIDRLDKINKGPMTPQALRAIYREIMSGAISLEKPLKIGFSVLKLHLHTLPHSENSATAPAMWRRPAYQMYSTMLRPNA